MPLVAEVLKSYGVYNPRKLFGVTELDVVRAAAITAANSNDGVEPETLQVPVIGGHSGKTILPLLSLSYPRLSLREEEQVDSLSEYVCMRERREFAAIIVSDALHYSQQAALRESIRDAGTTVVNAKGNGSATLSMAFAAARHTEKFLGKSKATTFAYVACKDLGISAPADFFATQVKQLLNADIKLFSKCRYLLSCQLQITVDKSGIRSVVSPLEFVLSEGEQKDMIDMMDELKANIDKGRNYRFKN